MCRRVECNECKRPTYAGCGMHVEQVLGSVPREARCACREKSSAAPTAKEGVVEASLFRRIFGLER